MGFENGRPCADRSCFTRRSRKHPTCALGCSRVLPLSMAQVGNIRLVHSGVPEFCHYQWHKSETSDLCTRVFPSSAITNGTSRKHPTCALGCSRVLPLSMAQVGNIRLVHSGVPEFCHYQWHKSETSDLCIRVFPSSAITNGTSRKHPTCAFGCSRVLPLPMAQVGNIRLVHSGVPEFCHH
jgi:hypothetical protein